MMAQNLLDKALKFDFLTEEEGMFLYEHGTTTELVFTANELRKKHIPHGKVTWLIDRNVNITNLCVSQCRFCNFCRKSSDDDLFVTSFEEYCRKTDELFKLGGNQLLLQGGLHPHLGLDYYCDLFARLKKEYPLLRLHALGPPEIVHLARMENLTYF